MAEFVPEVALTVVELALRDEVDELAVADEVDESTAPSSPPCTVVGEEPWALTAAAW